MFSACGGSTTTVVPSSASPSPAPASCLPFIEQNLLKLVADIDAGNINIADAEQTIKDLYDFITKQGCSN